MFHILAWLIVGFLGLGLLIMFTLLLYYFFILPVFSVFSKKWRKKYDDFYSGGPWIWF